MVTSPELLADPPADDRRRELWLQHAVGRILMENARDYARSQLAADLSEASRRAAEAAIDDAIYAVMMIFDGIPAPLRNDRYEVRVRRHAQLVERTSGHDEVVADLDLFDDGACMGFHFWIAGEFGDDPVVV